jgi:hypothetical protein
VDVVLEAVVANALVMLPPGADGTPEGAETDRTREDVVEAPGMVGHGGTIVVVVVVVLWSVRIVGIMRT